MQRAGVIAECKGSYLLVLGDEAGKWSLIKGHLEGGETERICAEREFMEEVGGRLEIPEDCGVWCHKGTTYFRISFPEMFAPKIMDTDEIRHARWFSERELAALDPAMCNIGLKGFLATLDLKTDDGFAVVTKRQRPRPGRQACRSFMSSGACKYGNSCRFKHC